MLITLSGTVQIIIAASAVIVALRNIYTFFKEPKALVDKYIEKEKDTIISDVTTSIEESLKVVNKNICDSYTELLTALKIDRGALQVILYREIERMYEEKVAAKCLNRRERQHLLSLYEQYVKVEGNGGGYIERLKEEMDLWESVAE